MTSRIAPCFESAAINDFSCEDRLSAPLSGRTSRAAVTFLPLGTPFAFGGSNLWTTNSIRTEVPSKITDSREFDKCLDDVGPFHIWEIAGFIKWLIAHSDLRSKFMAQASIPDEARPRARLRIANNVHKSFEIIPRQAKGHLEFILRRQRKNGDFFDVSGLHTMAPSG